jgi:hypothetical protein
MSPLYHHQRNKEGCRAGFYHILLSAAGIASVFKGYRLLAWVVIASSDFHLFIVLLLAALLSVDEDILKRHRWMTAFLPRRRTAGLLVVRLLFVAVISGFAGLYVGTEVFPVVKTPLDALYVSSFTLAFPDYSLKPGYGQLVFTSKTLIRDEFPFPLRLDSCFHLAARLRSDLVTR